MQVTGHPSGKGRQLVTVENKGAFVDYPLQPGVAALCTWLQYSAGSANAPLLPATVPGAHSWRSGSAGIGYRHRTGLYPPSPVGALVARRFDGVCSALCPPSDPPSGGAADQQRQDPLGAVPMAGRCDKLLAEALRI